METSRFEDEERFNFTVIFDAKKTPWNTSSLYFSSPEKIARLFLLKEIKPSPDRAHRKYKTFATCFRHYDILDETGSFPAKMTLVHARARVILRKSRSLSRLRLRLGI